MANETTIQAFFQVTQEHLQRNMQGKSDYMSKMPVATFWQQKLRQPQK